MRRISMFESHDTQTGMNVSVALKLTLARFINSSLLAVFLYIETSKWYEGGDLVHNATILIISISLTPPTLELISIPRLLKMWKIK